MPTHDLGEVRKSFESWLGQPDHCLSLRRPSDPDAPDVPTDVDMLIFCAPDDDQLGDDEQFAYITTCGLSAKQMAGPHPLIELLISVQGPYSLEELATLARRFAELAVVPYRDQTFLGPNMVLRGVSLPLFEEMSCALLTDYGVRAPFQLPGLDPPVRLLCLYPLYESEARVVDFIGDLETNRQFRAAAIPWDRPNRPPVELELDASPPPITGASDVSKSIDELWNEIESWLESNAPTILSQLHGPVGDGQLDQFEQEVGITLPDDFKASLGRHDGGAYLSDYELLPLTAMRRKLDSKRKALQEGAFVGRDVLDKGRDVIQNLWWHASWIPFAADSGGNLLCIDMAPAAQGTTGQVLYWERHTGPQPSSFSSYAAWLSGYLDDLERGAFEVDPDGFLIPIA